MGSKRQKNKGKRDRNAADGTASNSNAGVPFPLDLVRAFIAGKYDKNKSQNDSNDNQEEEQQQRMDPTRAGAFLCDAHYAATEQQASSPKLTLASLTQLFTDAGVVEPARRAFALLVGGNRGKKAAKEQQQQQQQQEASAVATADNPATTPREAPEITVQDFMFLMMESERKANEKLKNQHGQTAAGAGEKQLTLNANYGVDNTTDDPNSGGNKSRRKEAKKLSESLTASDVKATHLFQFYRAHKIINDVNDEGKEKEYDALAQTLTKPLQMSLRLHRSSSTLFRVAKSVLATADICANEVNSNETKISEPNNNNKKLYVDSAATRAVSASLSRVGWLGPCVDMYGCENAVYHATPELEDACRTLHSGGLCSFQEAVSAIPALLLDVRPWHQVLDMCAAPGSKTLQAMDAALTPSPSSSSSGLSSTRWWESWADGVVWANEKDRLKAMQKMPARFKRYHAPGLVLTRADATQLPPMFNYFKSSSNSNDMGNENVRVAFDRIICDVPCSGDGTVRKEPGVLHTWSAEYGASLVQTQQNLLKRAMELLKPGGLVVYSTCSLDPFEDEGVVCNALRFHNFDTAKKRLDSDTTAWQYQLLDANAILNGSRVGSGSDKRPDGARGCGLELRSTGGIVFQGPIAASSSSGDEETEKQTSALVAGYVAKNVVRVLPHRNDSGGFFVAAIRKSADVPIFPVPVSKLNNWTGHKRWELVTKPPQQHQPQEQQNEERPAGEEDAIGTDWTRILEFYGITGDKKTETTATPPENCATTTNGAFTPRSGYPAKALLGGLVPVYHVTPAGERKRIVVCTRGAASLIFFTMLRKGPGVELVTCGVRLFERLDPRYIPACPCRWRAVSESAEFLARYATKRKIIVGHDSLTAKLLLENQLQISELPMQGQAGWSYARFFSSSSSSSLATTKKNLCEMTAEEVPVGGTLIGVPLHSGAASSPETEGEGEEDEGYWWLAAMLNGNKLEVMADVSIKRVVLKLLFGLDIEVREKGYAGYDE